MGLDACAGGSGYPNPPPHRCVSRLCVSWAGGREQVATARQAGGAAAAAAAAASRAGEISWEIDTDKSSTLRLPGRRRRAEEAAGAG